MSGGVPAVQNSASKDAILQARAIEFTYGVRRVLHGLDLQVRRGEFLALAGPNGAGKTTLLHVLTGFLKPCAGAALLDGRAVGTLSRSELASCIAFVPQRSDTVFPFRVLEMVLMGRHAFAGLGAADSADDVRLAMGALMAVGLEELADRPFDQLSGGERQLVLVARGLAQKTPILILDEPNTSLDLRRQHQLIGILKAQQAAGVTILATFHDLNLAARCADRIALLSGGRIAAAASAEEVLRPEILEPVYGLPLSVERRPGKPPLVELPGGELRRSY